MFRPMNFQYDPVTNALNNYDRARSAVNQLRVEPSILAAKNALLQAQAAREQALAQNPLAQMRGTPRVLQTPAGYMVFHPQTGNITPLVDAQGKPVMPMKSGLQVSATPGGGFTVTTGGMELTPSGTAPVTQDKTQDGAPVVSPMSASSKYSGGGKVYINPQTGAATQVGTKGVITKIQNALKSESLVSPELIKIYNDIAPLAGLRESGKRLSDWVPTLMGEASPQLDAYHSALSTELPQNADQLLGTMGINGTEGNRISIQHSMTPKWYDNRYSLARRTSDSLANMIMRENAYKSFLKKGFPLQEVDTPEEKAKLLQALSDRLYDELTGTYQAPNTQSTTAAQQTQTLPAGRIIVEDAKGDRYSLPKAQQDEAVKQGYKVVTQ